MGLILTFLFNSQIFVNSYLYLQNLYSAVSYMYFMISLYSCFIPCMIRHIVLESCYPLQYLKVCFSMMSVHSGVGVSARDTRVYRLLM